MSDRDEHENENENQQQNEPEQKPEPEKESEESFEEGFEQTPEDQEPSDFDEEYMEQDSSRFEEYYDDILDETEEKIKKRDRGFLVELFDKIENFRFDVFKKKVKQKQEEIKEKKQKEKELKESATTIDDVKEQRSKLVKAFGLRVLLVGIVLILISGAIIYSLQDNEKMARPKINTKTLLNDTTSFGSIDQKDYFLEQNILNDKIDLVEKKAAKARSEIVKKMDEQTKTIMEITNYLLNFKIE